MAHFHSLAAVDGFAQFIDDPDLCYEVKRNVDGGQRSRPECILDVIHEWMYITSMLAPELDSAPPPPGVTASVSLMPKPFYRYCETYEQFLQVVFIITDAWRRGAFEGAFITEYFPGITETFRADEESPVNRQDEQGLIFDFPERVQGVEYAHPVLDRDNYETFRRNGIAFTKVDREQPHD